MNKSMLCYCSSLATGKCDFCTNTRRVTDYPLAILKDVFQHIYNNEPIEASKNEALMTISGAMVDIETAAKWTPRTARLRVGGTFGS